MDTIFLKARSASATNNFGTTTLDEKSEERLKAVLPDRAKMGVVRDVGLPGNDRHPLQPGQRDRQSDPNVSAHPQETLSGTATSTSLYTLYNYRYSTGH
jgi:hypothetical protein